MARGYRALNPAMNQLMHDHTVEELVERLSPKFEDPPAGISGGSVINESAVEKRWELLPDDVDASILLDAFTKEVMVGYERNIENFIGTAKVPIGLAGPLRVNGLYAQGDYYVPLATTEAALVASYARGSRIISAAGGCSVAVLAESVSRSPGFCFEHIAQAGMFVQWCMQQVEQFRTAGESTTRYGKFLDMRVSVDGSNVYLIFEFSTGDAAGQNMVTIATEAICDYIMAHCPVKPRHYFVEANYSGDKKASALSFQSVRGKKVTAEVVLPEKLVRRMLHTTPEQMVRYWNISALGGVLSGTIGVHGHYANGLAALYIATGQDAACVAESAIGVTRVEVRENGDLYAEVTLPNLIVGTVGGGTGLPSQRECLKILGMEGQGNARAFSEVCAALVLAGELSIKGALCAHHFTRAHQRLARGRDKRTETQTS